MNDQNFSLDGGHAATRPADEAAPDGSCPECTAAGSNADAPPSTPRGGTVRLVILGQAASKANSREIVTFGGRAHLRKSDAALTFEADALRQIPPKARLRLKGPVAVTLRMFYRTELPDLDESLVLDVLQDRWKPAKKDKEGKVITPRTLVQAGVYENDRQVREKHVYHGIDRLNPRVEVLVEPMQAAMFDQ